MHESWSGIVPYLFVQPTLKERFEYKVICLNGKAEYCAHIGQSWNGGRNRTPFHKEHNYADIKRFAESAIEQLRKANPSFIWDGLARVDIMYSQSDNRMVVNEFESLEAGYDSSIVEHVNLSREFLTAYWESIFHNQCYSFTSL